MTGRRRAIWATGVTVIAILAAGAAQAAITTIPRPATIETVSIQQVRPVAKRTLSISVYDICGPSLVWHHVELIERPKTKRRPFKSAVISVTVEYPAHDEAVSGPDYTPIPCPPRISYASKRIKFKRAVDHLVVFDGSTSPPTRIYPCASLYAPNCKPPRLASTKRGSV